MFNEKINFIATVELQIVHHHREKKLNIWVILPYLKINVQENILYNDYIVCQIKAFYSAAKE